MSAARSARDERFRSAVVDGGAIGGAAIDIATRAVIAGYAHEGVVSGRVLDLLLGTTRPSGPLIRALGGPPPAVARELYVSGPARAVYASVLPHGEVIVLATPSAMSVALGWALIRGLATAWSER
ncbi:MAG TPA: hypothetical protein VFP84_38815 [Kofleriaceae bacterium]|nr:hypothetical protein [Kofleriaceae bacterium]